MSPFVDYFRAEKGQAVAGESEISRAGRHFIVGPLADKAVADKVAEAVMQQNASLEVKIAEIVE